MVTLEPIWLASTSTANGSNQIDGCTLKSTSSQSLSTLFSALPLLLISMVTLRSIIVLSMPAMEIQHIPIESFLTSLAKTALFSQSKTALTASHLISNERLASRFTERSIDLKSLPWRHPSLATPMQMVASSDTRSKI